MKELEAFYFVLVENQVHFHYLMLLQKKELHTEDFISVQMIMLFFKFNHQKFYSIQALLGAFQKQNIIIDGKESSVYRCLFDSSKSGNNYIVDEDHDFMEE
mmetsp:Transcript_1712/g.2702  ORF Transcript_1712/g.2702 Transcript_1712/m.2702 type:complete len:101 (-) Transcript_1712:5-307(-)